MTRTYSQMDRADKYSEHSSTIWWVRPNGWVFIDKLSGAAFKSTCSHLILKFRAWFEQGVPWHSGNYRVCIHFQMRTWHDQNIQSNGLSRWVIKIELSHFVSEVKWLSELSGSGFEFSCSHLNFRFCAFFEQVVPSHSGNYRLWIHSEMRMWLDKKIQSNIPYR